AQLVDRIVAGTASQADVLRARAVMSDWRLNHERLSAALQNSLLTEDTQISQNLSSAGAIGLEALDLLASHQSAPGGWVDQQLAQLEPMKKAQSELILMVVAPIEKLLSAVGK